MTNDELLAAIAAIPIGWPEYACSRCKAAEGAPCRRRYYGAMHGGDRGSLEPCPPHLPRVRAANAAFRKRQTLEAEHRRRMLEST